MNLRKFQLSCKYFSGFTCNIDLDNHDSMSSVINDVKSKLIQVLKENNLIMLISNLEKINYHYHDYTFADTLMKETTFYICSHCNMININI